MSEDSAAISDEGQQQESAQPADKPAETNPVESKSTQSFPQLLSKLGISVLITTYQTGHVILARAESEEKLGMVFRRLPSPMGVAVGQRDIAIGTKRQVWQYRNNASLSAKLDPPGKHDVVFMPTQCKITGDIRVHEMVYVDGQLWCANTRFSCLATIEQEHSFVPQWRPPFISQLAAEDRCHLNGIALRDGKIAYVSALGTSDEPAGWRENKASGGVIMEYPSGKVVVGGLSMPHSPRWYRKQLFFLESGKGGVCKLGADGKVETLIELPGFTRGLAFVGQFAFVGMSKVRETNVFGGIQLNERVAEKQCGVAVVNIDTGKLVAALRFDRGVTEVFDVQLIRARWPDLLDAASPLLDSSFSLSAEALKQIKPDVDVERLKAIEAAERARHAPALLNTKGSTAGPD